MKKAGKCKCCGEQDTDHLFACPLLTIKCRKEEFMTTDGNMKTDETRKRIVSIIIIIASVHNKLILFSIFVRFQLIIV